MVHGQLDADEILTLRFDLVTLLVEDIEADRVAEVMSAFVKPRYCRKFYGTNITAGPLWAFNNLLDDVSDNDPTRSRRCLGRSIGTS